MDLVGYLDGSALFAVVMVVASSGLLYTLHQRMLSWLALGTTSRLSNSPYVDSTHEKLAVQHFHYTVPASRSILHGISLSPQQLSTTNAGKPNTLVVIIPGNPGVPEFYEPFMRKLFAFGSEKLFIHCLSHTGHSRPYLNHSSASNVFNLEQQIAHKLAYIGEKLAENDTLKLVLVGHSVGAHISLQLLKSFPTRISKLVLLQPTIMHIGSTPNGKRLMPFFKHREKIAPIFGLVKALPLPLKAVIARAAVGGVKCNMIVDAAIAIGDPTVVKNALLMAHHEMHEILDLDEHLVQKHQSKILFVYSSADDWVPPKFTEKYMSLYPKACHVKVQDPHAFMLGSNGSENMARETWKWIKQEDNVTSL